MMEMDMTANRPHVPPFPVPKDIRKCYPGNVARRVKVSLLLQLVVHDKVIAKILHSYAYRKMFVCLQHPQV